MRGEINLLVSRDARIPQNCRGHLVSSSGLTIARSAVDGPAEVETAWRTTVPATSHDPHGHDPAHDLFAHGETGKFARPRVDRRRLSWAKRSPPISPTAWLCFPTRAITLPTRPPGLFLVRRVDRPKAVAHRDDLRLPSRGDPGGARERRLAGGHCAGHFLGGGGPLAASGARQRVADGLGGRGGDRRQCDNRPLAARGGQTRPEYPLGVPAHGG